jgi:hypothetical protein
MAEKSGDFLVLKSLFGNVFLLYLVLKLVLERMHKQISQFRCTFKKLVLKKNSSF